MSEIVRRRFLQGGAAVGAAFLFPAPFVRSAGAEDVRTLILYNGQHRQTTDAVVQAFAEATGILIAARNGSSAQLANQMIEEGDASPADVFYAEESSPIAALSERGLLAKLDDGILRQVPARYAAKDGSWISVSARCRVVAYNKSMISESDMPASVLDFASDAWKDKVAIVPTSGAFQQQIVAVEQLHGRDKALAWLKGLKENGRVYNTNNAAMQAVEDGDIATALINNYYWFSVAREIGTENMRSALHYIGHRDAGALVTVSAAAVLKSGRKQALAQQFVAYMMSEEGQKVIAASMAEYPLRRGIKSPYALKPFEELDPPDIAPDDLGDGSAALALEREAGLA
ncbi:MAG: extracellular solute-binding protein [Shinella sp.]|nr:extracellular solute-binding protein [Shinella sp.]